MKLVLATSNKGKVKEIKALCKDFEVVAYSEFMDEFEIIEDALTFKENALIKARAVFKALSQKMPKEVDNMIVLADDSGISVDILDGKPGIYSARYGGENASDKDNLYKLIDDIKAKGVESSPAHYTAAIAIVTKNSEYSVHGWMYGRVITQAIGYGGFGYDPMFIPLGYDKTLGQLDDEVKKKLSHRAKALGLARLIIRSF